MTLRQRSYSGNMIEAKKQKMASAVKAFLHKNNIVLAGFCEQLSPLEWGSAEKASWVKAMKEKGKDGSWLVRHELAKKVTKLAKTNKDLARQFKALEDMIPWT